MDPLKNGGSQAPLYIIVCAILAASGIYYLQEPFKVFRPVEKTEEVSFTEKGIEARLWQDPVEAVRKHINESKKEKTDPFDRKLFADGKSLSAKINSYKEKESILILPVIVPGGHSVDDHETRLRTRYAVLAALDTAGYSASNFDRIYGLLVTSPTDDSECANTQYEGQRSSAGAENKNEPAAEGKKSSYSIVPYEWCEESELHPGSKIFLKGKSPGQPYERKFNKILIFWVEDSIIGDEPIKTLKETLLNPLGVKVSGKSDDKVSAEGRDKVSVSIIGPTHSDGLKAIIEETKSKDQLSPEAEPAKSKPSESESPNSKPPKLKIYSPWATVDPTLLDAEPEETGLVRTIANDGQLVGKLVEELKLRGVDFYECRNKEAVFGQGDPIALISEWDTFYGRALPLTFAAELKYLGCEECKDTGDKSQKEKDDAEASQEKKELIKNLKETPGQWPKNIRRVIYLQGLDGKAPDTMSAGASASNQDKESVENLERPEGASQLDYVRRLAEKLKAEENNEGRKFKAIGILGSDVYDKLLLLQALRDHFQHAIFFTTDMDARLLHPSQNKWTRNLLVVSSYGLGLNQIDAHGRDLPPFRDVYQTSTYVATLDALRCIEEEDLVELSKPKLYEIGRTEAVGLNVASGVTIGEIVLWVLLSGMVMAILLSLIYLRKGNAGLRFEAKRGSWFGDFLRFSIAAGSVVLIILAASWSLPKEPLTWFEGVSIWPSEVLRFLAAFLAFHFLMSAQATLAKEDKEISHRFSLPDRPSKVSLTYRDLWKRKSELLPYSWPDHKDKICVARLWKEYLNRGRSHFQWTRVVLISFLYFVMGIILFQLLGQPSVPYRGLFEFLVDKAVLIGSVGLLILLIFYVVDVSLLCERFIIRLSEKQSQWPAKALKEWAGKDSEIAESTEDWLDMQLIAQRTDVVGSFIVKPFIVIFIMILSRLSIFDRWDWPPSLIIILSLNAFIALCCAFLLSRSAKMAKETTLKKLKERRVKEPVDGSKGRLSLLIEDIENLTQGAFAPLSQQPYIRAVLAPIGGIATTILLSVLSVSM